jgi:hypothetical protein
MGGTRGAGRPGDGLSQDAPATVLPVEGRQVRQGIIRDTDGTRTMVIWIPQTSTRKTSYGILSNG